MTIFCIFCGLTVVTSQLMRVLGWPYHDAYPDLSFNSFFNAVYFDIITFSTIGYGDLLPLSWFDKGIVFFLGFTGLFTTSLWVFITGGQLKLNHSQSIVFHKILIHNKAANAIIYAWWFYSLKKRFMNITESADVRDSLNLSSQ